jgi:hypothetical protein
MGHTATSILRKHSEERHDSETAISAQDKANRPFEMGFITLLYQIFDERARDEKINSGIFLATLLQDEPRIQIKTHENQNNIGRD